MQSALDLVTTSTMSRTSQYLLDSRELLRNSFVTISDAAIEYIFTGQSNSVFSEAWRKLTLLQVNPLIIDSAPNIQVLLRKPCARRKKQLDITDSDLLAEMALIPELNCKPDHKPTDIIELLDSDNEETDIIDLLDSDDDEEEATQDWIECKEVLAILTSPPRKKAALQPTQDSDSVAATFIQARWKSFHQRQCFVQTLSSIVELQSRIRMVQASTSFNKKKAAATVIALRWRSFVVNAAATFIQAQLRAFSQRKCFMNTISSLIMLQSRIRTNHAVVHFKHKKKDATVIALGWRAFKASNCHTIIKHQKSAGAKAGAESRAGAVATIIQTNWRTFRQRQHLIRTITSIISLQSIIRRFRAVARSNQQKNANIALASTRQAIVQKYPSRISDVWRRYAAINGLELNHPSPNTLSNTLSSSCRRAGDVYNNGAGKHQYRDSEAPQGLDNEPLGRCTDEKCKWNPNLHKLKAACERCWTLASNLDRKWFVRNGGRSLRINSVKGGCPPSCKVISHEYHRLCRNCFDTMHRVGKRKVDPGVQE